MGAPQDESYVARSAFQRDLDRHFPRGAVCAILPVNAGRVQAAGRVEATGRLFCSDARRSGSRNWQYEVLIDTRTGEGPADELRIWIGGLSPHPTVGGLWEADVRNDREQLLRLNAAPPAAALPDASGREAVTRAHEDVLFPHGIAV